MATTYSDLPNERVSAANGIDYAYRDTGGGEGAVPASHRENRRAPQLFFGKHVAEAETHQGDRSRSRRRSNSHLKPKPTARPRSGDQMISGKTAITRPARSFPAAAAILAERDPVLHRLIGQIGPPRLPPPAESHFPALVRAIVYQQLAGAAAAAIFGRLTTALGGELTPQHLLSLPDAALRSAGLSGRKAAYLRDLAAKTVDGTVTLDPAKLRAQADEEVIARLSSVRGIGSWTAQMFLIFQLMRLDVWPSEDLGIRKGYGLAWSIPAPTAKQLQALGDPYRPYRSVVAWYCWRAAELHEGAAGSILTGSPTPARSSAPPQVPG